jgi:hypothetical protein
MKPENPTTIIAEFKVSKSMKSGYGAMLRSVKKGSSIMFI